MPDRFSHIDFPALRRRLSAWYRKAGRPLPWRNGADPYRVWISEIMLQQTTVAAVIPYFERFLARFPDVHALAAADEADVLRLWEGLGYYSRARNLHKAARAIVAEYGGAFPESAEALQGLPGIGRYTAGAIASFAFDRPAPIVEANTLRLYCRILGFDGDPRSSAGQRLLWEFAEAVLPRTGAGDVNQALMDVGATVCTPVEPDCPACPLNRWCVAARDGRQAEIPRPKRRPEITELQDVSVAVFDGRGRVLVRRRTSEERWAGLWDFPRWTVERRLPQLVVDAPPPPTLEQQMREQLSALTGLSAVIGPLLERLRHSVTRYRIELHCFTARKESGRLRSDAEFQWLVPGKLEELPLSVTGRKFARRLQDEV